MNLTDICVRKPVLAWMLMAATIVFGIVAASRIGISQFPDVDFPTINVSVVYEGAAPEVIENDVVEILEESLAQVEGMKSLTSFSRMGSANITIELDLSRNVDIALQDVQAKVSQATRRLPRDIDPPVISKSNPEDQPILSISLGGPFPQRVLSDYVRYGLREKLQTIPGVGEITLMGALDRNVRIWLDATKLDEKGLTVSDVITALQREHVELPAGRLETPGREMNIRVLGEALDLETLRQIVVREVSGSPIYISDIALVEDGFEDVRRVARVNGLQAQGMMLKKQRGANAVAVAQLARKAVDEYAKTLPEGMTANIVFDSTQFIKESVTEIQFELILSVLLTALVCWMFLGSLSSTLNVILAIPMSLLGTIAIIYFLGFTFNTFTLLALALAVGIVVDDAIMVMENIFRHREGGKGLVKAALEGTHEIAFAALAATLAVVAIFIPVVFMKGIIGRFFLQFGITLCLAVLLSYIEAISLAPARCSQFLKTSREGRSRIGRFVDNGLPQAGERLRPGARARAAPPRPHPDHGARRVRRRPGRPEIPAGRIRPIPGPEPTVRAFPDRRRLGHHRDRQAHAEGGGDLLPPARGDPALQLRRRHGRRRGELGKYLRQPAAAQGAEAEPGRDLRCPAPGAELDPRGPGRHPGPLPAGTHGPARVPGRILGARLQLG